MINLKMKTTRYDLKSRAGTSVEVPADYAEKAERLVDHALSGVQTLRDNISNHQPYLGNPGIISRARSLAETQKDSDESLRLQDELYLRICSYGAGQEMQGLDKEQAFEMSLRLEQLVRDLESQ